MVARMLLVAGALQQARAQQVAAPARSPPGRSAKGNKGTVFQPVDGGMNRVCRGANFTDDPESDYMLHLGVATLGDCMRLCIEAPVCKGVEYNPNHHGGRCEVWTRAGGINATAPVPGFTCLRYGAVTERFDLLGGGANRACRGSSPEDNSEAYYTLHKGTASLAACKELCIRSSGCKGVEYNEQLDGGRCEVWTRTAGISSTAPASGFMCLTYGTQEQFEPVDGGSNRVCRGASPQDNSESYYAVYNMTATLDDCKRICAEAPVCKGIEYNQEREGGRCEVWTRTAGISATAPGRGFTCLQYGTVAEQFALADGGGNRACRGADPDDNSPLHYVLHKNTSTLSACKELCINAAICKGIEYSPAYDGGRCEVWTRAGGVGATAARPGSVCLRYGASTEKFELMDGVDDRVCRGAHPGDDSPRYYELHTEIDSLAECKTLCINAPICKGIEYIAERGRCEVWTREGGVQASRPANGSSCLRYGPSEQFDLVDGGVDRACRGASPSDDSPRYFVAHTGTASLADCQTLCIEAPVCKGIEYNSEYDNGRCEVWTREGGITASSAMSGSTCLSYGKAAERFLPVDGGVNRVCRGAGPDDNAPENYMLHTDTPSLGACKSLCIDAPVCKGIEYSADHNGGRCEVWTRTGGILATRPVENSTCLAYGKPMETFEPLDGGADRVCRGESPHDDSPSYYVLHLGVETLAACKTLCVEARVCKGVEYNPEYNRGRCEVWTRLGGVGATAPGVGSVCWRYGSAEPFMSFGRGRACRGARPTDDSPRYYVLHKGVASLDDCKTFCIHTQGCKGIEYNRQYDSGRCEVWTRTAGISATAMLSGSECLRYGRVELFQPMDGGEGRACRGASPTDDSPSYYVLHLGTPTLGACRTLCADTPLCRGIEYNADQDGGRCEVWTRVGGIKASRPMAGVTCLQYGVTLDDPGAMDAHEASDTKVDITGVLNITLGQAEAAQKHEGQPNLVEVRTSRRGSLAALSPSL